MGNPQGKSNPPEPESIVPFFAPLQALQNLLAAFDNQGGTIGGIAASHPNLEKKQIQYWIDQFGEALDLPDL